MALSTVDLLAVRTSVLTNVVADVIRTETQFLVNRFRLPTASNRLIISLLFEHASGGFSCCLHSSSEGNEPALYERDLS